MINANFPIELEIGLRFSLMGNEEDESTKPSVKARSRQNLSNVTTGNEYFIKV